jgi:hypothetical protein
MSVNRVKKFLADHESNPPDRFNIGGKQFTWESANKYVGNTTDIKVDQHETESDMVAVDSDPEVEDTGSRDSQSQE